MNKYSKKTVQQFFHAIHGKKVYVGEKRTLDTGSDVGRMVDDDECDLNGALFIMSNRCVPHPDFQSHSE